MAASVQGGVARPNVLLIVTDDQRDQGSMAAMPRTAAAFGDRGTEFSNAYVTTPVCCPSRASIFSGRYAHNHAVVSEHGKRFDQSASWPRYLHDAGYRTGIVGKYLNGVSANKAKYFDYRDANTPVHSREETRTAATSAETFLDSAEQDDAQPWALTIATYSPHRPYTVQPKDPFPYPDFQPGPSFGERDLSDKNPVVAKKAHGYDKNAPTGYQEIYDGQMAELEAADEMVGSVLGELDRLGERDNTIAIFTSDNGFLEKDHSLYFKLWPYLDSVAVPLYLSWPGHVAGGAANDALVANIDIAPTIYDATGVAPGYTVDGHSLLASPGHDWLLLELPSTISHVPAWYSYLDGERQYIDWTKGGTAASSGASSAGRLGLGLFGGPRAGVAVNTPGGGRGGAYPFVEDYDLTRDPAELSASNAPDPAMASLIEAAKSCAGAACP
jgi:arylsulfatase A-like enzyme